MIRIEATTEHMGSVTVEQRPSGRLRSERTDLADDLVEAVEKMCAAYGMKVDIVIDRNPVAA